MKNKIGFFDSGIGGVTILRECIKLLSNFEYIYYSDSVNNPYGDKSGDELITIVDDVVSNLIDMGCGIIVIACNTASCICVDYLRNKYLDINFIAVEPALKMAYDNSEKNVLVLATDGTIKSEKFYNLLKKYSCENCKLLSCIGLADLIEKGDNELIKKYLFENLSYYRNKVSSVVLGCTHYPLIKDMISDVLGDVIFYDSADGVVKQLKRIIDQLGYERTITNNILFFDSSYDIIKEQRFFKNLEGFYE